MLNPVNDKASFIEDTANAAVNITDKIPAVLEFTFE